MFATFFPCEQITTTRVPPERVLLVRNLGALKLKVEEGAPNSMLFFFRRLPPPLIMPFSGEGFPGREGLGAMAMVCHGLPALIQDSSCSSVLWGAWWPPRLFHLLVLLWF